MSDLYDRQLRIGFRVDASKEMGGGHVMRCLTLADALAERGARCTFLSTVGSTQAAPRLATSTHSLIELSSGGADIPAALRKANINGFDWIVVDNYALDSKDERIFRSFAHRILVIDDLADRTHDCDVLIDTVPGRTTKDYAALVPKSTRLLLGASYAAVRREFIDKRPAALAKRRITTRPSRILVSFGLTDVGNVTAAAVIALASFCDGLIFDVVLAKGTASLIRIEALARSHPDITIHIHSDPPSMSELMLNADIAVGASGATGWERACLALPSVVFVLAENQRQLAQGFAEQGAVLVVDEHDDGPAVLARTITRLIEDRSAWLKMSESAAQICDGRGSQRIVDILEAYTN